MNGSYFKSLVCIESGDEVVLPGKAEDFWRLIGWWGCAFMIGVLEDKKLPQPCTPEMEHSLFGLQYAGFLSFAGVLRPTGSWYATSGGQAYPPMAKQQLISVCQAIGRTRAWPSCTGWSALALRDELRRLPVKGYLRAGKALLDAYNAARMRQAHFESSAYVALFQRTSPVLRDLTSIDPEAGIALDFLEFVKNHDGERRILRLA